ncbi:unnamed protein product [Effrenium voratum]|uniref:Uncharacterized protein n=1 Tax=Effrenium voratum TaxID=2562239 RepID=A0AA36MSQ6_9DINO|nr:unnamed protein product [Effrenium voratum]
MADEVKWARSRLEGQKATAGVSVPRVPRRRGRGSGWRPGRRADTQQPARRRVPIAAGGPIQLDEEVAAARSTKRQRLPRSRASFIMANGIAHRVGGLLRFLSRRDALLQFLGRRFLGPLRAVCRFVVVDVDRATSSFRLEGIADTSAEQAAVAVVGGLLLRHLGWRGRKRIRGAVPRRGCSGPRGDVAKHLP